MESVFIIRCIICLLTLCGDAYLYASNLTDLQDENLRSGIRRQRESRSSQSSQEVEESFSSNDVVYVAQDTVTTHRLILKKIRNAVQEVRGSSAIFEDYKEEQGWPTHYQTRQECEVNAQRKEELGEYNLGFEDYHIHLRDGDVFVGQFMIGNEKYNGRLETCIYILSSHRGQGYGPEAIAGVVRDVIQPGLGKSYRVACCRKGVYFYDFKRALRESFVTLQGDFSTVRAFQGVHASCNLANYHRDNDYGSIMAHYQGGYGVRCEGGNIMMFYPIQDGETISLDDVSILVSISKIYRECLGIKMNHPDYQGFWGDTIDAREMVKRRLYGDKNEKLRCEHVRLLRTDEPHTFFYALDLLHDVFGMKTDDLKPYMKAEKASKMLALCPQKADEESSVLLRTFL